VKFALAQINPTVGDFSGNIAKILSFSQRAEAAGADLVIFPEMSLCGYPPADLLEKPIFLERAQQGMQQLAAATAGKRTAMLVGFPSPATGPGKRVKNCAAILRNGEVAFTQTKMLLPYYDVFDEQRYFKPAEHQDIFQYEDRRLALSICEDAWNDKNFWPQRLYPIDPLERLMAQGADVILNISASPYSAGKRQVREDMIAAIARRYQRPVILVNQVGGNDSLLFDGTSLVFDAAGTLIARGQSFEEDLLLAEFPPRESPTAEIPELCSEDAAMYAALVMGVRDYVRKCGFSRVIIGLSGGIDSALVAAIAVDALGEANVLGIGMPGPYSSPGSLADAEALARNLGIEWRVLPIGGLFTRYLEELTPLFAGLPADITEENLQSRIRGTLLMAVANKQSSLVLTTGNKSEMSTGYCTLYGDMVGALAVIGDVYKTAVYRLAAYVNRNGERIPEPTLRKPPSAELRPDQRDTDSLPPYEILDPVLEAYIDRRESAEEITSQTGGRLSLPEVRSILRKVERSEYKRQQAAPVLKVTAKAFGFGRRFPIAARTDF
jgi:NAD+ synthase (glutamine-hydrolysing)